MKKLILLFVLTVGLSSCSNNQDSLIEEVALQEKKKGSKLLSKDMDRCCGDLEDDIAIVETEMAPYQEEMDRIEAAARDRMGPGDIGPRYTIPELVRISHLVPDINMYNEMLEGLTEEYNRCISL